MIDERQVPLRIRKLRLERSLTQQQLADAAGVTKGYISRIENSASAPPVGTLIALAQALGVDFNAFFEAADQEAVFKVTKSDERPLVARDSMAPFQYEHLALAFPNRAFEPYVMKVGTRSERSQPNQHAGQEMLFVLKGMIEFNIDGQTRVLKEGDCVFFNSGFKHFGASLSENGAEVLAVIWDGQGWPSGSAPK